MDHEYLLEAACKYKLTKINNILGVYNAVEGTKTFEGQKDAVSYWSHNNFSYIDRFLKKMPVDYILDYKKEQTSLFIKKIITQYENTIDNLQEKTKIIDKSHIIESMHDLTSHSIYKSPIKKFAAYKKMLSYFQNIKN